MLFKYEYTFYGTCINCNISSFTVHCNILIKELLSFHLCLADTVSFRAFQMYVCKHIFLRFKIYFRNIQVFFKIVLEMNKIIILRIFLIGNTLYNSRSREIRVPPRTRIGSISSTWRRGHLESEYHEELEARSGSAGGYSRTRDALVAMAPILSRDVSNNRAACTKLSRNACFVRQRLKFY